jgi:hypothetical protein
MDRPRQRQGTSPSPSSPPFTSLKDFYPYYRTQHRRRGTRVLHFAGTTLFLVLAGSALAAARPSLALLAVASAYSLAWVGHFFIERNKPATFKYPLWSLMSDFIMYFNILTRKESF